MRSVGICVLALLAVLRASAASEETPVDVQPLVDQYLASQRLAIASVVEFEPGEEDKFWPLYAEYREEFAPVLKRLVDLLSRYQIDPESIADEEADDIIDGLLAANTDSIAIQRAYLARFREVLPARQVLHIGLTMLVSSP